MFGTFTLMECDGDFFVVMQIGPFENEEDANDELQNMFDAVDADDITEMAIN